VAWDDNIKGTNGADIISGGNGDDFIQGKAGNDVLNGDDGNDQLHGDDGNDHLRGGRGDDFIHGGTGIDTAYYSGSIVEYTHSRNGENLYINHVGGSMIDGNDRLLHVERLVFADAVIDLTQNNAPVAFNDVAATHEDVGTYSGSSVLANDFDWEGDSLTVTPGTFNGLYGQLVLNANGTYTYSPFASTQALAQGQIVQDSFTYTVSDGSLSDTGTLTISVSGNNDAPVANPDTASTGENASVSVNVLANDSDVDNGAVLTVTAASAPAGQGSASVVANQVVFNPGTDFDYLDTGETAQVLVNYTIKDEHGATASSTVTITVNGANDAPVANDDTASTSEDASVSGNVLANDTDVDVEPLTVANPGSYVGAFGTLTLAADGSYSYAPNAAAQGLDDGETGQDVFSYTASDGTASDTATLTVTVNGANDAPVANDDTASTNENSAGVSGNVLANDTDVDGEALTVANPGTYVGAYGTLTLAADGSYTYVPGAAAQALDVGETAQDVFSYAATDGTASDPANLTVTITGLNDAPVANDDVNVTDENSPVSGNVLANDTDVDVEPLTVSTPGTYNGFWGTLVLAANGNYTYTPNAIAGLLNNGQSVVDVFGYNASDGTASDSATITITINGLSGVPNANNDSATTTENSSVSGNVLTNDTDAENDPLTVSDPGTYSGTWGTLVLNADGSYTYTPNAAANGLAAGETEQDVFSYTATDGGASDTATLTVTVNGVNDAPTITGGKFEGSVTELDDDDPNEDNFTHSDSGAVTFNDVDLSDTHSASVTPQGGGYYGTFTVAVDQMGDSVGWEFTVSDAALEDLSEDQEVTQVYAITINDGHGGTVTQDVTITINGAGVGTGPQTVWYIDNSAAGSTNVGTSANPFTSIAAFNAAQGTLGGPQVGQTVHLLAGLGTYAEADGINLLDGQTLIGEADGALRPTIVATAGDGIDVAENNTISGIDIGSTSGAGIDDDGGTVGTLTVTDVGIGGVRTGQIVDIDHGGTLDVTLNAAASAGSSGGAIDLNAVVGSFTVVGATSISGATGGGVDVTSGINLAVSFQGGLGVASGASTAVNFQGNMGSSTLAVDGLDIVTTTGTGLNVTSGGSVTVTGTGSTIATAGGTAVSITFATIGAAGVTLESVSTTGAASGIVLNTTGAGGFSVTGDGTAGSGGTIAGSTNAGINLTNTGAVSFTDVTVSGGGDDGIRGSGVAGLELVRTTVAGNGNAVGERGVDLTALTGISTVTDSSFTGSAEDNFSVVNSFGTLDLTVTGSTFGDLASPLAATADDGLIIQANGTATVRASITNSTFVNNRGDHFQYATDAVATSTGHIIFNDNVLTSTFAGVLGGGVTISPAGGADVYFAIEDNNIQGAFSSAISAATSGSTAAGEVHGTIAGNTIGTAGVLNSGSASGNGINVTFAGAGSMTVLVDDNDIQGWSNAGINSLATGSGRLNATITDNVIDTPGAFGLNSIRIVAGASSTDSAQIYLELSGNDADTALPQDIFVRTRFNADILMPGYAGAANDAVAADAFITADNPLGGEVVIAANALAGSGFFDTPGSAAVPLPVYPDAPFA
jgi:VCBS repeat-containing protein